MSKELEAFRDILGILSAVSGCEVDMNSERIKTVKSALQRLEAIDNANPSEALKCLEFICKILKEKSIDIKWIFKNDYETIKQALLKAQEQEKEIDRLENQCLDILAENIRLKDKSQEQEKENNKLKSNLARWLELLETDGIDSKNMVATDIQRLLEEIGK